MRNESLPESNQPVIAGFVNVDPELGGRAVAAKNVEHLLRSSYPDDAAVCGALAVANINSIEQVSLRNISTPLIGNLAVGYSGLAEATPLNISVANHDFFAIAGIGNIERTPELQDLLGCDLSSINDADLFKSVVYRIMLPPMKTRKSLRTALELSYELVDGQFSGIAMGESELIAFDDQHGNMELSYGTTEDGVVVGSARLVELSGVQTFERVVSGELIAFNLSGRYDSYAYYR